MATKVGSNGANKLIKGSSKADMLFGLGGKDKLVGGGGNDWLNGGAGNDKLVGGGGADTFVFDGAKTGKDVITDFKVAQGDILAIAKGLGGTTKIMTADDVIANATQNNKNVVINLGGGSKITLKNVSLDDLKDDPSAHFAIV